MAQGNILEVSHLNVFYKNKAQRAGKRIQACRDISFVMNLGEILGVLGESGCGKSTLARTILGMNGEYDGEIRHSSKNPQMVFQDPYSSLNPAKKIGWILEEPLCIRGGIRKEERRERARSMLSRVGLEEKFLQSYPHQLSGGQRQRVCIASALMLGPGLLVADEPVSALDVTIQAQIIRLLLKLHKEMGLSILFISHDLRLVYQMSDRVLVMSEGAVIESGEVERVYRHPVHAYTKMLLESAGVTFEVENEREHASEKG